MVSSSTIIGYNGRGGADVPDWDVGVFWSQENVNAWTAKPKREEVEIDVIMSGLKKAIKTVSSYEITMFFDVSAILTLLKIMNVDYEALMQLRRLLSMQTSCH